MASDKFQQLKNNIDTVIFDIDWVFTNWNFIYTADWKVAKIFWPHDADGVKLLRKYNINIQCISADKRWYPITKKTAMQSEGMKNAKPKLDKLEAKYKGKTQDYWPKLVNDFKQEGKMFMYINLAGSIAREINDMTLEIDFPNGMSKVAKDFLSRPDTKQELKETVHLACGKEMQIKFVEEKHDDYDSNFNEFEKFIGDNDIPFNII